MYERPVLTADEPKLKLVMDEKPPMGVKIYMVSEFGAGFIGDYHPELGVIAWSELPKLSKNDKLRLQKAKEATTNVEKSDSNDRRSG